MFVPKPLCQLTGPPLVRIGLYQSRGIPCFRRGWTGLSPEVPSSTRDFVILWNSCLLLKCPIGACLARQPPCSTAVCHAPAAGVNFFWSTAECFAALDTLTSAERSCLSLWNTSLPSARVAVTAYGKMSPSDFVQLKRSFPLKACSQWCWNHFLLRTFMWYQE